ncbi:MAG: GNAT family N-acetyltransferase [Bdellovibrionia bacterium]
MIQIRTATDSDAQPLADLARTTFVDTFGKHNTAQDMSLYVFETYGADKQLQEIRDPNRRIEIAWSGNLATGFFHLVRSAPHASVLGPKPIELLRLYVSASWHGKGVGSALTERAIQIAHEEGFETLWLGVWEQNLRAQAFYAKYQFSRVGEKIFRLGKDDQIDFVMTRPI